MKSVFGAILLHYKRRWREIKWSIAKRVFLLFGIPLLQGIKIEEIQSMGPFDPPKPAILRIPNGLEHFEPNEVLNGAYSTAELCGQVPNGLWIEIDGLGECIRYYSYGLSANESRAVMVYFGGDVLLRNRKGVRSVVSTYSSQTPASIIADMAEWSSTAGVPAIFIARPGMFGSSGDHNMRRHVREIDLMECAIDQLKRRYNIERFILAGQSGGGQIVAGLLNRRTDISAAILSSGLVSVKQVSAYWEYRRDIPSRLLESAQLFYDPLNEIGNIPRENPPQIFVISDPEDQTVPFYTQLRYVRQLKAAGLKPVHIYVHGPAPSHHNLSKYAKLAAALVARGKPVDEIMSSLATLDVNERTAAMNNVALRVKDNDLMPYIDVGSILVARVAGQGSELPEILVSKAEDKQFPPASLTKLLTAMVALDVIHHLALDLTYPVVIETCDLVAGSGQNVRAGDVLTFEDALANLMLQSSNVTANAVARTFGTLLLERSKRRRQQATERFVAEMNVKARHLNMNDSHFSNPSGLSTHVQLTTASDLLKLAVEAARYPEITRYWDQLDYVLDIAGPEARKLKIENPNTLYRDYDILGGKTGSLVPGLFNIVVYSQAPKQNILITIILKARTDIERSKAVRTVLDRVKRGKEW